MANSPTDTVPSLMAQEFGTKCLITETKADKYLDRAGKHGEARFGKWCGGKNGFDDYAERLH